MKHAPFAKLKFLCTLEIILFAIMLGSLLILGWLLLSHHEAQAHSLLETVIPWLAATCALALGISRLFFFKNLHNIEQVLNIAQHAQAAAEEAVKTKARFLATMSHEIRTPMNGVIGMTRLLMNTPMNKKQSEFVESINIPEIIGKRILIVENNSANYQALQDFCSGWGAFTQACGTSDEASGLINNGHTYDIALVDSNLPNTSALDFAKCVRRRYSKQELPLILIAPPNDHHPKDIVRELFNLYLTKPLTRSRLFDSLMTVLGELNLVTTRPEPFKLKLGERLPLSILLAEDNPINQIVATSILDEMAYNAEIAENGQQALDALRKKPYDVIFMDMQMPEMDGLEATRRIRAEFPADRQPIIIAMTANAMEGDKQDCLNAGMNDYISKPVMPEAIEAALQRSREALLQTEVASVI